MDMKRWGFPDPFSAGAAFHLHEIRFSVSTKGPWLAEH